MSKRIGLDMEGGIERQRCPSGNHRWLTLSWGGIRNVHPLPKRDVAASVNEWIPASGIHTCGDGIPGERNYGLAHRRFNLATVASTICWPPSCPTRLLLIVAP